MKRNDGAMNANPGSCDPGKGSVGPLGLNRRSFGRMWRRPIKSNASSKPVCELPSFPRRRESRLRHWIPASAGMTNCSHVTS
jgi:hypothetical protein